MALFLLEEEEEVKEGFLAYDFALDLYKSVPENLSADKKGALIGSQIEEKLKKLYDAVSAKYDIGDYKTFLTNM